MVASWSSSSHGLTVGSPRAKERAGGPYGGGVQAGDVQLVREQAHGELSQLRLPGRGQRLAQFAGIGGDNRVRSEALIPPARDVSGPARKLLLPDPVRRELIPQHGQLIAHRRHLHAFVRSRNLG